jgi:hypothetical protein
MDDVAVNAHVAQARRDSNRLVGDNPDLLRKVVHLHRKAHRRIDRPHALPLQHGHDLAGDLVDVIAAVVELQIGDRPGRAADRLPVHLADKADESPGGGKGAQNIVALVVEGGPADFHETNIVGAGVAAQLTQPVGIEPARS